eukprot:1872917-Prymnesium_polylepis.2
MHDARRAGLRRRGRAGVGHLWGVAAEDRGRAMGCEKTVWCVAAWRNGHRESARDIWMSASPRGGVGPTAWRPRAAGERLTRGERGAGSGLLRALVARGVGARESTAFIIKIKASADRPTATEARRGRALVAARRFGRSVRCGACVLLFGVCVAAR